MSKSEREAWIARVFARSYNVLNGTDYEVHPALSENDSADAYLVSISDPKNRRGLQLCLSTTEERRRGKSLENYLETTLRSRLTSSGYSKCEFDLIVLNPPQSKNEADEWVKRVEALIEKRIPVRNQPRGNYEFCAEDLALLVGTPVSDISCNFVEDGNSCEVVATFARSVPEVARTLQNVIDKKVKKSYVDVEKLWLILQADIVPHTPEEIREILGHLRIPQSFAQVWYVYPTTEEKADLVEIRRRS